MVAVLVMAGLLTAAACDHEADTGSGNGQAVESLMPESADGADEPLGKYDPPIEITALRPIDNATKYRPGDSPEHNVWIKGYEEELGIKIKFPWSANFTDNKYDEKMNVALASGDIANVMQVNPSQLKRMVEAGQLEELTDLIDRLATPLTKDILSQDGGNALKSATFGGKLMALPITNSAIDSSPVLWVRTDWLKKLQLPEPKTMDDVVRIAEAFAYQDPDGNGKPDTIGLGVSKELWGGFPALQGFFNAYHAYPNLWIKDREGKLAFGSVQPEMKPALAMLQDMYQRSLLDKEFALKDGGEVAEDAINGKVGMYFGDMWTPLWPLQNGKDKDPEMEWAPYPVPSADGKPAFVQNIFPVRAYFVVTKGTKHPEAIVKMLNMFVEKSWGEHSEPLKYSKGEDGLELFKYAVVQAWPANSNLNVHLHVAGALATGDTAALNQDEKQVYDKIKAYQQGDRSNWGMDRVFGEVSAFSVINNYVKNKLLLATGFYGAATSSMSQKQSALDKKATELFTKIIMGSADIDDIDRFVESWSELGGKQITDEVNAWAAQNN